jgi:hypothetical protein
LISHLGDEKKERVLSKNLKRPTRSEEVVLKLSPIKGSAPESQSLSLPPDFL